MQIIRSVQKLSSTETRSDGRDIPEGSPSLLRDSRSYEEDYDSVKESSIKAKRIIGQLIGNNAFSIAREVSIRTYDSSWFSKETDVSFKYAMAKELRNAFSIDGYRNTVWEELSTGKNI